MGIVGSSNPSLSEHRIIALQATLLKNLKVIYRDRYGVSHEVEIPSSPSSGIVSSPPSGKYKVINIYVDPATGKCVVEYEDTPIP